MRAARSAALACLALACGTAAAGTSGIGSSVDEMRRHGAWSSMEAWREYRSGDDGTGAVNLGRARVDNDEVGVRLMVEFPDVEQCDRYDLYVLMEGETEKARDFLFDPGDGVVQIDQREPIDVAAKIAMYEGAYHGFYYLEPRQERRFWDGLNNGLSLRFDLRSIGGAQDDPSARFRFRVSLDGSRAALARARHLCGQHAGNPRLDRVPTPAAIDAY